MNLLNIKAITKKEIKSYINNPAAYIVLIAFSLMWQFLFFKNALIVGESSLRNLFEVLPWLLLIFIPAITMGSISKEKDEGTLELILTHPVSDIELILGKILSAKLFVVYALLFTFPLAFTFSKFGKFDWGVYAGQLIGSILLSVSLISLGIYISSLVKNQIASLIVTMVAVFFLIVSGSEFLTISLPFSILPIMTNISVLTHFQSTIRGVLDLRDLLYFLSFTLVFISLAFLQLSKRRYGNLKAKYKRIKLIVLLLILLYLAFKFLGSVVPGRLDLTQEKVYTLSESTKKVIGGLENNVEITFYASGKLPSQYSPVVQDVKDVLRDYRISSNGKIIVKTKDPSLKAEDATEATTKGIQEIQFNVIGQEEFQVKTGFLGVHISAEGKEDSLPFIQQTDDLEYMLTSIINKLTAKDKKTIGFLSGHGEKELFDYVFLNGELTKQYETKSITLDKTNPVIDENIDTLVIAGPTIKFEDNEKEAIMLFMQKNKNVLFLIDTYSAAKQLSYANVLEDPFAPFLENFGIKVNQNIVYDLQSNETLRFTAAGGQNYFLPYPFWVRGIVKDPKDPITLKLNTITMPWPSSVEINEQKLGELGLTKRDLVTTTKLAGLRSGSFTINPQEDTFPQQNLAEHSLVVALEPKNVQESSAYSLGKMVVAGNSELFTDQFVQQTPENFVLALNIFSWLSGQESFADIKSKSSPFGKLVFTDPSQPAIFKYGNMAIPLLIPSFTGLVILIKRNQLKKRIYLNEAKENVNTPNQT